MGELEAPGARQNEKFEKVRKSKRLGSSIGSLFGHILTPLPPKVEPASDFGALLCESFFEGVSRSVPNPLLAVF